MRIIIIGMAFFSEFAGSPAPCRDFSKLGKLNFLYPVEEKGFQAICR